MKPGEVVDVPGLGVRVQLQTTAAETGGESVTFEVSGRPRGLLRQAHVHAKQHEHIEVLSGALRVNGRVLGPGESIDIAPGEVHTQQPVGEGEGRVRITHRPAGRTEEFLTLLTELDVNRFGIPKPLAGARLIRDFGDDAHAAKPPLRVQKALSRMLLRFADSEYTFVDEWDVAAPPEAVWDALADGRTYPQWWKPVYISVEGDDGPPAVGHETRQHFKGRLPYHLHTRTQTVRLERPRIIEGETDGDLRGHGLWTLTPTETGTRIRFDWQVHADRRLLRALTPVLRPALRWNHNWAIARAREGLEPFVAALSERVAPRA